MLNSKLVWVAGGYKNENQQGAHLLQTRDDQCQIRWLTSGTTAWIAKSKVTEQLLPRARRRPGKFRLVDPQDDQDEPMVENDTDGGTPTNDGIIGKHHQPASVQVREEARQQKELGRKRANNQLRSDDKVQRPLQGDDDDTASMSSSSMSSITHEETNHNASNQRKPTISSTVNMSESVPAAVSSSSQSLTTSEQTTTLAVRQPSAFSIFPTSSSPCLQTTNEPSLFSARYAAQTIGSAVSRRIKSIFTWKRRPRRSNNGTTTTTRSLGTSSNKISGTKRPRVVAAGSRLSGIVVDVSNEYSPETSLRKKHRTSSHATAASTSMTAPSSPSPSSAEKDILIDEVIRRIALEPYDQIREGVASRRAAGKSLNTRITLRDSDGSEETTTPLLSWARDRYEETECSKTFLSDTAATKKDASETLKLLLDNGANPYVATNGQTLLSAAIAAGHDVAVAALLDQAEYTLDQLNILDNNGDTALHSALRNGNFTCLKLFVDKFSAKCILEQVLDAHGENVLFTLVRHSDIPYDQDVTASPRDSNTLAVLKRLLRLVDEQRLEKPLIHKNKNGETVMAVASMSGCLHEVKELSKIEFDSGRSIGNRCKEVDGLVQSPLDLARETLRLVEDAETTGSWRNIQQEFERRRIGGIGHCAGNRYRIGNWVESGLEPVIDFLEEIQQPLQLDSLQKLSRYRRRVSKVTGEQVLTKLAQDLQDKYAPAAARNADPPSIRCDLPEWKCINGSRSQLRAQLLDMVRNPFTIPKVTAGLIRDPKDPCIRSSNSTDTKHYGLFANDDIPKHTVVCEYSGLVRREDEEEYDPNPEYGVKLTQCDEWAYLEGGNYADAFILDAANVFNEASLINDVRHNVLEDEDDSEHDVVRTENVAYVEVLVNKWPRVFIITIDDVEAGSELLIDYGASYWEKLSVSIMKEKLETEKDRVEELEAENARLREQLKQQQG